MTIIWLAYLQKTTSNIKPPRPDPKKHFVADSVIYDENFETLMVYNGMGVFFDDGTSIVASHDDHPSVIKYSASGDVIWKRDIYTHHQMNLSIDKKRLLLLSTEVRPRGKETAGYDTFLILDVMNGKTLAEKSSFDFIKSHLDAFSRIDYFDTKVGFKTMKTAFHFNSFYEIPPNLSEKTNRAFKRGNFIVNDAYRPYLLILDSGLKDVVWSFRPFEDVLGFHDVQFQEDGKILFYRGSHLQSPKEKRTVVFKFDPVKNSKEIIFPEDLKNPSAERFTGFSDSKGSAQETTEGYLISHHDSEKGGMIIFTDKNGHLLKTLFNPIIDKVSQRPAAIQQIKQYDLSEFFKNRKIHAQQLKPPTSAILDDQVKFDSSVSFSAGNVVQISQETVNVDRARKLLKNKLVELKLAFAPQAVPYPGMLTKEEDCYKTAKFADKIEENFESLFWFSEIPATENFDYASCGNAKDVYWSQFLMIYCKKKQSLFQIKYFSKDQKFEHFGRAIAACLP